MFSENTLMLYQRDSQLGLNFVKKIDRGLLRFPINNFAK